MIQIKRGLKPNWLKLKKPLSAGQPGYDKERHKIKIGDGDTLWEQLPYASGLFDYEILNDEAVAKERHLLDNEDTTLITYGVESPDENTIGKLYLQHYDAEPEVDYVISFGVNKGWTYQKWKSGIATCYGTFDFTTTVQTPVGDSLLYQSSSAMNAIEYPFKFVDVPSESVSVASPGGHLVWLAATKNLNTSDASAVYSLISPDKLTDSATYRITLRAEGRFRIN